MSTPHSLLTERTGLIENFLIENFLATRSLASSTVPERLAKAIEYSLLAKGKRLRPVLCLSCALACAEHSATTMPPETLEQAVLPFAAALEMIHTYSLVHDDLPAMDDDDFRRGRPSCHKAFDEATAILAGDALLTDAFGLMTRSPLPADRVLEALRVAAGAAGAAGMVGGQMLDLQAEGHSLSLTDLRELNAKKTGALLRAACECGAVLAGASPQNRLAIRSYGEHLGLAFQITDDILDVVGDKNLLGKPVGSDAEHGKATWPGLLGLDEARARAKEHCRAAEDALASLERSDDQPDINLLRHIAQNMVDRKS